MTTLRIELTEANGLSDFGSIQMEENESISSAFERYMAMRLAQSVKGYFRAMPLNANPVEVC